MTDREKLLVAVLSPDDDDRLRLPGRVELSTLDVMAMLFELGDEYRAGLRRTLVDAGAR